MENGELFPGREPSVCPQREGVTDSETSRRGALAVTLSWDPVLPALLSGHKLVVVVGVFKTRQAFCFVVLCGNLPVLCKLCYRSLSPTLSWGIGNSLLTEYPLESFLVQSSL